MKAILIQILFSLSVAQAFAAPGVNTNEARETQKSSRQPAASEAKAGKPIHPEADRLLRAASASLVGAKDFSLKAEVWEDEVIAGHKVQTTKTVNLQVRRPDGLHVEVRSPKRETGFWYDGKSLAVLNRRENLYGSVPAPHTIQQLLDDANDKFGMNFPLEDLLVDDLYARTIPRVKGGAYFGKATVLGVPCKHLGFSSPAADWQLWVEDTAQALPRKLVLTYKLEDTAPQYTAIFSDWKLNPALPSNTFVFTPPKGAAKIDILPAAPAVSENSPVGGSEGP